MVSNFILVMVYYTFYNLGKEIDPNNRILAQQISSKKNSNRHTIARKTSDEQSAEYCHGSSDHSSSDQM